MTGRHPVAFLRLGGAQSTRWTLTSIRRNWKFASKIVARFMVSCWERIRNRFLKTDLTARFGQTQADGDEHQELESDGRRASLRRSADVDNRSGTRPRCLASATATLDTKPSFNGHSSPAKHYTTKQLRSRLSFGLNEQWILRSAIGDSRVLVAPLRRVRRESESSGRLRPATTVAARQPRRSPDRNRLRPPSRLVNVSGWSSSSPGSKPLPGDGI